ncbi:MAG: hypothetical protein AAF391_11025 [Bacteroidota bacterium]
MYGLFGEVGLARHDPAEFVKLGAVECFYWKKEAHPFKREASYFNK